ncbi:MAG: MaoC family dehydratase N-terminal domain-containing protein [Anaerolineae bacterium]|jgi:acyl dehydratase|nr:MaoC family dehydratase N-terminal domain-containing protein [Anaerolineae bacterium]
MRYTPHGPQGYYFEEIELGQVLITQGRTITEADIVNFGGIIGDYNPLHFDAEFMKKSIFGQRIAHGMLVLSFATGLGNQLGANLGTVLAFKGVNIEFRLPVYIGDTIRLKTTVTAKRPSSKQPGGWITQQVEILNQGDQVVQAGEWSALIAYRPQEA